ncbi:MAG: DUF3343 domain-containing protein [Deltaproteobacteria bacterium]|jgi:hypothetical protein|nr:DUF3343 domain-containing protein [Deltaproteobacteria bacterium]
MESTRGEIILVFSSNTRILLAEELLEELELPFILVPVPKEVNPNCGLAISFKEEDRNLIMPALDKGDLWPQSSYIRRGEEFGDYPLLREDNNTAVD